MKSAKLFWKVYLALVILMLVSAGLFGLLVTRKQARTMQDEFADRLHVSALLLGAVAQEALVADRPADLQPIVRGLSQKIRTRLTVVGADGRVLADSEKSTLAEVEAMDNHLERPEIQSASSTGVGPVKRHSVTIREPFIFFAVRIENQGQHLGYARAGLPERVAQSRIDHVGRLIWLSLVLISALGGLGAYYLIARMTRPLTDLTQAVDRIANANSPEHIHVAERDEVGLLARSFNRMRDQLAQRTTELRQRGDQLAAVVGGMVEGVVAVDERAHILFANESAGRLFDFDATSARGRPLLATIRNDVLQRTVKQAVASGDIVNAQIDLRGPHSGTLAVHATPLPGDPCPGVVLVLYDMTELRRLESLRQEFVANVSHELKTPLSSIKAYAETLREGAINDPQHNLVFVKRIEDQADRLHELILDLISLARIEAGQHAYEIEDVDVGPVVDACLEHYRPNAGAKQLDLQAEPPPSPLAVRADDEALRQILDNLVNNAIKYTPPEGKIRIAWRTEGRSVLIEVSDTGIGVAPDDQPRLFERFFRVDKARSRELGGTGLGLSIVKHLAQFFGGSVGVRSRLGEGSVFWVRLPAAVASK